MDIPMWFWVLCTGLFGLLAGSYAGAQVWRLRARQLVADKAAGETYDKTELRRLKPLATVRTRDDRSRCLTCGHQLAWYDLLPLVSWLSTAGRCRYCREQIGWFEPVIELGLAAFLIGSQLLWPVELNSALTISQFIVWVLMSVPLAILFAYDAKWFLLPDAPMATFIGLATVFAVLTLTIDGWSWLGVLSVISAVAAIAGLYWVLHAVSGGRWVGFGDVTLGIGLGLLLGRWELAIIAVFLANLIGTLIVLPGMLRGKLGRGSQLPFGPMLILGAVVAYFWGQAILDWYLGLL